MAKTRVLVQAGHVAPREPGFESGTGTVREQEWNTAIRDELCKLLKADGRFEAIPVPGDIPNGIKVDAAIFEHGDGAANQSVSGFSFGFPSFKVNARLAKLIGDEYLKVPGHPPHHMDNYTADLHFYYGFSRVDTAGPEVLVESGFLTNPAEQKWMFGHVDELARAQYVALCKFFGFVPRGTKLWKVVIDGHVYARGSFRRMAKFIREHPKIVKKAGGAKLRRID